MSDSGYADSNSKSTAYYSDISITVYDQASSSQVQSGPGMPARPTNNNRSEVVMVEVKPKAHHHFIHPQIQPASVAVDARSNRSHSTTISHLALGVHTAKSLSVNDFTGSIIAADRMNYYNKQQQAAAAKLNKNILDQQSEQRWVIEKLAIGS
jgi:hypothetical protein